MEIQAKTMPVQPPSEYLAFRLGEEEYGVDILNVQEIRGYDAVTRIADASDYVKGVINLRGRIVPIVDLRIRFKLAECKYDAFTVVIIIQVADDMVGLVVDSVSDVISLAFDDVKPAPEIGSAVDTSCLTGIGTLDGRMLILLDIERLVYSLGVAPAEAIAA